MRPSYRTPARASWRRARTRATARLPWPGNDGSSRMRTLLGILLLACALDAQTPVYDLLLKGGHVIDGKNNVSAIRDVAIAGGRIAAVAANIDPAPGVKVVNASGLYVVPGLVDIHAHVYTYNGQRGAFADDHGVIPDGFTFRAGVTAVRY